MKDSTYVLCLTNSIIFLLAMPLGAEPLHPIYQCRNVEICRNNLAEGLDLFKLKKFDAAFDALGRAMDACGYQKELKVPCQDPIVTFAYASIIHHIAGCSVALEYYLSTQEFRKFATKSIQETLRIEIEKRLKDPVCSRQPVLAENSNSKLGATGKLDTPSNNGALQTKGASNASQAAKQDNQPSLPTPASPIININCDFRNMKIENNDGIINLCGSIGKAEIKRQKSVLAGLLGLSDLQNVRIPSDSPHTGPRPPPERIAIKARPATRNGAL